jgi:hypothetical protein
MITSSWTLREKVTSAVGAVISAIFVALGVGSADAQVPHAALYDFGIGLVALSWALAPQLLFRRVGARFPLGAGICASLGAICFVIASALWLAHRAT